MYPFISAASADASAYLHNTEFEGITTLFFT